MTVTLADIRAARHRIAGHIAETPVVRDDALSDEFGLPVLLKCEYRQATGAFKPRLALIHI